MQRLCSPALNAFRPLGPLCLRARGGCVQRPRSCLRGRVFDAGREPAGRYSARVLLSRAAFVGEDVKLRTRRGVARAADAAVGRTAGVIQARVAQNTSGEAIRRRFLVRAPGPLRCLWR